MLVSLFGIIFSSGVFAADCESLFEARHEGLRTAKEALSCFEKDASSDRSIRGKGLSRRSYLKFFIAEHFDQKPSETLLEGIALAEEGLLLFGAKYDVASYGKLSSADRMTVAELLYNYGLTTARYVDLAGPLEAIRRMEDIKKSMNSIIRMKEEGTAFFGAHRTLGIFHMKVPAIAGGDIKLSEAYLTKARNSTLAFGSVSAYPSNNLALAELYLKLGQTQRACGELLRVSELTDADVVRLNNGHILETKKTIAEARELKAKKCR